ncbi:MAG TPA: T9SS type A sorting domain-containing protein, partial [Chryseolinea sp.]|nr:T9SS type A sorting domain-containing protein [Chryseolinea sp.]
NYKGDKIFSIYPNPSNGLTLNVYTNFSPEENSTIVVYDNLGAKVGTIVGVDQNSTLTFLNPLNRGVYYVKIVSNNFSTIERFVVR